MSQNIKPPVRLIFHVGNGKTGTSSIQHTFNTCRDELKKRGVWYLGMMLEHANSVVYPWQKPSGTEDFLAVDIETAQSQVETVLEAIIDHARRHDIHTLVWSNEWFATRGNKVIPVLKKLDIDLAIVIYVRRHDAWIKSAYVQWGLKHKTYPGPVLPFDKWIDQNKSMLHFSGFLKSWVNAFDDAVVIRNVDAVGDSVVDFLQIVGLRSEDFLVERKNESPSAEELLLRALFNNKFRQAVRPQKFNQTILGNGSWLDLTADEFLRTLMPSPEKIHELSLSSEADRFVVDELLARSGGRAIDTSPLLFKPHKVDSEKLLLNLSRIVVELGIQVQALRVEIEQIKAEKSTEHIRSPDESTKGNR